MLNKILVEEFDYSSSDDKDHKTKVVHFVTSSFHMMTTQQGKRFSSVIGRKYIYRDRISGNEQLFRDYFSINLVYPPTLFRMNHSLFLRILNAIQLCDDYFV